MGRTSDIGGQETKLLMAFLHELIQIDHQLMSRTEYDYHFTTLVEYIPWSKGVTFGSFSIGGGCGKGCNARGIITARHRDGIEFVE